MAFHFCMDCADGCISSEIGTSLPEVVCPHGGNAHLRGVSFHGCNSSFGYGRYILQLCMVRRRVTVLPEESFCGICTQMTWESIIALANVPGILAAGISVVMHVAVWLLVAVAVIFFFGLSVFVHELGHFIAARMCGLRVDAFSLGFGPSIWRRTMNGTEYKVCWIPLGGYVSLPQLDPEAMQTVQGGGDSGKEVIAPAAWWKRIIVSLAGPAGNVALAIMIALIIWAMPEKRSDMTPEELRFPGGVLVGYVEGDSDADSAGLRTGDMIFAVRGKPVNVAADVITETHLGSAGGFTVFSVSNIFDGAVSDIRIPVTRDKVTGYMRVKGWIDSSIVVVGDLIPGSPAEKAGLKKRDILLSINGETPLSAIHAAEIVRKNIDGDINVTFLRGKNRSTVCMRPEQLNDGERVRPMIGVVFGILETSVPQWMAYKNPVDQIRSDFKSISRVLSSLFFPKEKGESKQVLSALGGPVQIFYGLWVWIMSSFVNALGFIRFLNINLAVMNLLPIPVLDGGHIVFALWRGIFRREIPSRVLNTLVNAFALLLIAFFVYISFRDVGLIYKIHTYAGESENVPTADGGSASPEQDDPGIDSPALDNGQ